MKMHLIKFLILGLLYVSYGDSLDRIEFSKENMSYEAELKEQIAEGDNDARTALGRLYFMHNRIKEAQDILELAVSTDPKNAEALAWLGANNTKKAGKMFPWLMGIRKLGTLKKGLAQIDKALKMEPNNITVKLISVNTGAEVKRNGSLENAKKLGDQLLAEISKDEGAYPNSAKAAIFVAVAKVEKAQNNNQLAEKYANRALDFEEKGESATGAKELLRDLKQGS